MREATNWCFPLTSIFLSLTTPSLKSINISSSEDYKNPNAFFFLKDFYLYLREGKGGREERNTDVIVVVSCVPPAGDLACHPGMCPHWGCLVTFGFIGLSHTSQGKMLISCSCYSPSWICWDSAAMSSPQEPGRETSTSNVAGPHSGRKKTLKDITPAIRYSSLQEIHITFVR